MTKVLHLESKPKALKLGGMLDTLERRLDQARKDHLGYVEFLELLLEDESQRRANKSLAARIAQARSEGVKTIGEFSFNFNPKLPAQQSGTYLPVSLWSAKNRQSSAGLWGRQDPYRPGFRGPGVPAGL